VTTAEVTTIVIGGYIMDLRVAILALIQLVVRFSGDRTLGSSIIDDITLLSENMRLYLVVTHTSLGLGSLALVRPRGMVD
jgi:hypothetical protein